MKINQGYTLIEILVAVGVFFIVIAAPTGFFVGSLKGQQKALSSQELLDQTSYVLEYMSRSIRMAKKDLNGECLTTAGNNYETDSVLRNRIRFINYQDQCQEFFWEDGKLKEKKSEDNTDNFTSILSLTSDSLEVLSFKVGPSDSWAQVGDDNQPRVTLLLKIKGTRPVQPELRPIIRIQTAVSQRDLDVIY